jgi:hypothetical protein
VGRFVQVKEKQKEKEMRKTLILLILTVWSVAACSQIDYSNDSLRVTNAEWSIDSMDGFTLKR